jgi:PAS domain S-box-containing protein
MAALAAAIPAVTLVSFLGGRLASRRLARSVATLTEKQPPKAFYPVIAEIETVRTMLSDAAAARDASEEAFCESETRFRATFEQAAVGIAHVATDGRWLRVNQKLCDIVGYSREELLTKTFQDITHPDDVDADLGYMQQMLVGQIKTYSKEKRYFRKDGSLVWVALTVSPVCEDPGKPNYFISVVEDITKRKQAEEQLQRSRFVLIEAQKLSKTGNWEWDVKAGLHAWSEEIYTIYGRDPKLPPADIQEVPKYFTPESWTHLNAAVEDGITKGLPYACDAEVVRPDGTHRWITSRGEAVRDAHGAVVMLRGTVQDITERKLAEEEIRKLNEELEQRVRDRTAQLSAANKELEAFSFSVSHDLRAPLRHLTGFVELLNKRATMLDDKSRHYLEVIGGAASQMGRLVDDLLSFSRMGRSEIMRSQVDLRVLLDEAIHDLRTDTEGRNIIWDIKALPAASGDPAMLKLVFVNLLSNALKFTRTRERAVIEVGCDRADGGVTFVYVRDNGVGFDMKYVDKLFHLFQRLHRHEEFEGTGVGLANVRRIIHRHGGKTWAKGEPGQGATVFFSLPDIKGG